MFLASIKLTTMLNRNADLNYMDANYWNFHMAGGRVPLIFATKSNPLITIDKYTSSGIN